MNLWDEQIRRFVSGKRYPLPADKSRHSRGSAKINNDAKIVAHIKAHPWCTSRQIAEAVGVTCGCATRHCTAWFKEGRLEKVIGGTKTCYWKLTEV